jgi:hypothetical protein
MSKSTDNKKLLKCSIYVILIITLLVIKCNNNEQKIKSKKIKSKDIVQVPWEIPIIFAIAYIALENCKEGESSNDSIIESLSRSNHSLDIPVAPVVPTPPLIPAIYMG